MFAGIIVQEAFPLKLPVMSLFSLAFLVSSTMAQDTVQVSPGWNIIGSLSTGAVPQILTTIPPGIIATSFYGYSPGGAGYSSADTLKRGLGYWVKVTGSGSVIFSTTGGPACPPTVFHAGKVYNTIRIGTQCWLRENLDVGTMVPGSQNQTNNSIIEKYCYGDDPSNCATYGGLYQWDEAMQYATNEGAQGICPPGWHIPTLAEFQTLSSAVSGDGNALKRQDQGSGAGQGTNASGFSALLAGYRGLYGIFATLGDVGYFWSSTQFDAGFAHNLGLYNVDASISLYYDSKILGLSVRCLED